MINMMRASVLFLALSYGSAVPAVQPDTSQNKKETREAGFRLVMSKNDDICTPLLAIANRYLVDSDRIPSEAQRQDLTLVSWNRVHYDDRSPSDQVIENALLDINNDGRK